MTITSGAITRSGSPAQEATSYEVARGVTVIGLLVAGTQMATTETMGTAELS